MSTKVTVFPGNRTESSALSQEEMSSLAAVGAALSAVAAKMANNESRVRTLGIAAAKYARDPAQNPALTTRQIHELLARVALSVLADD